MNVLKSHSIISHITGFLLFFSTPLFFAYGHSQIDGASELLASPEYWFFTLYYTIIYFLLSFFVVPKLYERKRYPVFSIIATFLIILTLIIKPFDSLLRYQREMAEPIKELAFKPEPPPDEKFGKMKPPFPLKPAMARSPRVDIIGTFLMIMLIMLVVATESVRKWRLTEQRVIQAEADKVNAELSFLKAQINPHFLFNTLNNIYSLAVNKSEHTADAVMKLSNIMRYVTDEAHETMVPLESEIECIRNYASLQRLRLGENVTINLEVEGDTLNKEIPPLVLMTFVENAFKHGISNREACYVNSKITAQPAFIHFSVENKLFLKQKNIERTGIGIENTKKRLQALYQEKHLLEITEAGGQYKVQLILYS